MNRHSILPMLVLAFAFSVQPLNAAKKKAPPATAPGNPSSETLIDIQSRKKTERAHHLAEKSATREFLNSADGISFKKQIASTDDEINAVYEKNLNVFREDAATEKGKKLREERDRQVQLLKQKRDEIETEFEKLSKNSPVYRAMLERVINFPCK